MPHSFLAVVEHDGFVVRGVARRLMPLPLALAERTRGSELLFRRQPAMSVGITAIRMTRACAAAISAD